jgi:hypothetical protein
MGNSIGSRWNNSDSGAGQVLVWIILSNVLGKTKTGLLQEL